MKTCKTITIVKNEKDPTKAIQLEPSWKEKHIFSKQYDMFLERSEDYRLNLGSLYQLIWGQCSTAMKTKLKTLPDFDTIQEKRQCIALLQGIQGVTYHFESKDYLRERIL